MTKNRIIEGLKETNKNRKLYTRENAVNASER